MVDSIRSPSWSYAHCVGDNEVLYANTTGIARCLLDEYSKLTTAFSKIFSEEIGETIRECTQRVFGQFLTHTVPFDPQGITPILERRSMNRFLLGTLGECSTTAAIISDAKTKEAASEFAYQMQTEEIQFEFRSLENRMKAQGFEIKSSTETVTHKTIKLSGNTDKALAEALQAAASEAMSELKRRESWATAVNKVQNFAENIPTSSYLCAGLAVAGLIWWWAARRQRNAPAGQ